MWGIGSLVVEMVVGVKRISTGSFDSEIDSRSFSPFFPSSSFLPFSFDLDVWSVLALE